MTLIDLSRRIDEATPVYPSDPLFRSVRTADHETDGFQVSRWTLGSHTGTHIDAPLHFFADAEPLDAFAPETFYPTAVVCDLVPLLDRNGPGPARITTKALEPFEPCFKRFSAVLLRTGWETRWGARDYFTAFPSIEPETAEWLADFPIMLLGLDTPSLSAFGGELFDSPGDGAAPWGAEPCEALLHSDAESHRILLGRRPPVLILENLCRLDALLAVTAETVDDAGDWERFAFRLACFPIPIGLADAAPVRAVAVVPEPA